MRRKLNRQARYVIKVMLDTGGLVLAFFLAYLFRFEIRDGVQRLLELQGFFPLFIGLKAAAFVALGLHKAIWRYSSVNELVRIIQASAVATALIGAANLLLGQPVASWLVFAIDWFLTVFIIGGLRMVVRRVFESYFERIHRAKSPRNVLIYGAGRAGELLIRNIQNTKNTGLNLVGIIDDDPMKQGRRVHNVPVIGTGEEIGKIVQRNGVTDIYFAISSISGVETRRLVRLIHEKVGKNVDVKIMPGLQDLVDGRVSMNQLRRVELRDLLRRPPVELDRQPVADMIRGRRVLVVGGGGSIGSELCRQIAQFEPDELIVLDSSEYNLYKMEGSLRGLYPGQKMSFVALDATHEHLMRRVFEEHRPHHIFHAAAYKHVPMMEMNPHSAVYNNLTSTQVLTELADEFKVDRFVLISTDKAVQPTNVMGASKRACELLTLSRSSRSGTKYMAVRFGNVLGSSGSVVPRFRRQIEEGGPVTVTHPEITRYFMLISEAVELVLQAGAIGENGNIYVLDMGEPIKILDLAHYMIKLSGLSVNEDVKIEFTGLRPGEKMYESLHLDGEELNTSIPGLMVLTTRLAGYNGAYLTKVKKMLDHISEMSGEDVRLALRDLVPEFRSNEQVAPAEDAKPAVASRGEVA